MNERIQGRTSESAMGTVLIETEADVATLILSNPGNLNALSAAMWTQLGDSIRRLSTEGAWRCLVIRGADGHFAAGADIREFPHQRGSYQAVRNYHEQIIAPTLQAILACPHPIVASISGVCAGGGLEIACCCDLRIGSDSARLGVPINRLGFPMAPAELAALLAVVGRACTLELLLEGRMLSAHEALGKGLLTRVVADEDIEHETHACVRRITQGAPLAARANKQAIRRLSPAVQAFTEEELQAFFSYWDTHDHQEGVAAFLEKRTPEFRGC